MVAGLWITRWVRWWSSRPWPGHGDQPGPVWPGPTAFGRVTGRPARGGRADRSSCGDPPGRTEPAASAHPGARPPPRRPDTRTEPTASLAATPPQQPIAVTLRIRSPGGGRSHRAHADRRETRPVPDLAVALPTQRPPSGGCAPPGRDGARWAPTAGEVGRAATLGGCGRPACLPRRAEHHSRMPARPTPHVPRAEGFLFPGDNFGKQNRAVRKSFGKARAIPGET
jgi:hypothetical protein